MKENTTKTIIAAALAGAAAYFKVLLIPFVVLLAFAVLDYITGMAAAAYNGTLSSAKGRKGIIKKLTFGAIIAVAVGVDWVIRYALVQSGISLTANVFVFGLLVTIWLIINELISILENITKMDIKIPGFLQTIVKKLSVTVEAAAEKQINTEDEKND